MSKEKTLLRNTLPWWTWVLPLLFCHLGTEISLLSKISTGTSLLYFPAAISVVLVYWWGPRILLACFINATLSAGLWGLGRWELWPVYAAPEVIFVFLSWLFFIKLSKGKSWLPDIKHTVLFLVAGIIIPLLIYKLIQESIFVYLGDLPSQKFWNVLVKTSVGDFISLFGLTIPVLYFFSRPMAVNHLTAFAETIPDRFALLKKRMGEVKTFLEFLVLIILLVILSQTIVLSDYWFVYGSIALYAAIRWGMGSVVLINSFILFITYLIPSMIDADFIRQMSMDNEMVKIQLGSSLLYVFSTITGRVISDVSIAEKKLHEKNSELEQTNKELDRFVYSVSHDLSAPLKSIQGLVNISLLEKDNEHKEQYLSKIGQSAAKLDFFIKEILDYSRNKRMEVRLEEIPLLKLCEEIVDDLKYMDHYQTMKFDLSAIGATIIYTDRLRLKIILNNLFSNAIKFQKRKSGHESTVQVLLNSGSNLQRLTIKDNGDGIKPEFQLKIFEMFYRASEHSNGSGLGLYIAQEAAEKLGGKLLVKSEYGKGSEFIIEFPFK